jgi:hypothetical protein
MFAHRFESTPPFFEAALWELIQGSDDRSHPSEDGNRQSSCSEKNVDDGKSHNVVSGGKGFFG